MKPGLNCRWLTLAGALLAARGSGGELEELRLGGIFPLSGGWYSELGSECLAAALLAVDHINKKADVLPGYNLVLHYNDNQGSTGITMNIMFEYLYGSPAKPAIIGPLFSEPTRYAAEISGLWKVLLIGYGATTPTLSHRKQFPYFFRTISSAVDFGPVRVRFIKEMGWDKVASLTLSQEPYASVNSNFQKLLKAADVSVVAESFLDSPKAALERLKGKDARVIFGNFFEGDARTVFCEAYKLGMYGSKYVWVVDGYYTPGWWGMNLDTCSREEMLTVTQGYYTVVWNMMNPDDDQITVSGYTTKEFRQQLLQRVNYTNMFTPGRQHIATMAYDATWAAALALNTTILQVWPLPLSNYTYGNQQYSDALFTAMEETNFSGVTGPVSFTKTGDRAGLIILEQFENDTERTIGYYRGENQQIDWLEPQSQIWKLWGGSPPPDEDNTEVITVYLHVNVHVYYAYTALSCAGALLSVCFLVFNVVFRKRRVIKMSSPNLNNVIVVGCIVTFVAVTVMGLDTAQMTAEEYALVCQASPWVLCIGFTLAFGAMFAKTWRVYSIFTNKSMKKKSIKDWSLFIMVGVFLLVDVLILSLWQGLDPLTPQTSSTRVQDEGSTTATVTILRSCSSRESTIWTICTYGWKGILMVFGIFITWQTRNVSIPGLNDSKYIGFSIYNVVVFSVIGAPLSQFLGRDPNARYIIIGGFIIFCTTSVLCLLFIPKILAVLKGETGDRKGLPTAGTSTHSQDAEPTPPFSVTKSPKVSRNAKVAPEPSVA